MKALFTSFKMENFLNAVIRDFKEPLEISNLLAMSEKMQVQFKEALAKKHIAMLPSYQSQLLTGVERGTYLVIDVGGSILRLGLVELKGRDSTEQPMMSILKMDTWKLGEAIKALIGPAFFDWIASKIDGFLSKMQKSSLQMSSVISMGLAWSYPVEYIRGSLIILLIKLTKSKANVCPEWEDSRNGKGIQR